MKPTFMEPHAGGGRILAGSWTEDSRFEFALFVPERSDENPGLLVVIHGSERDHEQDLRNFLGFARAMHLVILAPRFPPNVLGDGNQDGYKFLHEGEIRYDRLLIEMVEAAGRETGCRATSFLLHGYSGGGQFAHRFLLLHPHRLRAVSIGAPGEVTLTDWDADWWGSVRDTQALFDCQVDPSAIRQVRLLLAVGEQDDSDEVLKEQPPSRFWPSEEARVNADRRHRLDALRRSLEELGARVDFRIMAREEHKTGANQVVLLAQAFFSSALARETRLPNSLGAI